MYVGRLEVELPAVACTLGLLSFFATRTYSLSHIHGTKKLARKLHQSKSTVWPAASSGRDQVFTPRGKQCFVESQTPLGKNVVQAMYFERLYAPGYT